MAIGIDMQKISTPQKLIELTKLPSSLKQVIFKMLRLLRYTIVHQEFSLALVIKVTYQELHILMVLLFLLKIRP